MITATATPRPAAPAPPPPSGPSWHQHLKGLPAVRPSGIAAQVADPRVRTAIAGAYRAGGTIGRIQVRSGYSRRVVQLVLTLEDIPRPHSGRRRTPDVPDGHDTWGDYTLAALRGKIADGAYPAGSVLPAPEKLAAELGTRCWAVRRAIPRLAAERLLLPTYRGTVVLGPRTVRGLVAEVTVDGRVEHWHLPGAHRARADAVRWTLLSRIADDSYVGGRLPSRKALAVLLPESVHVVRTAVGLLTAEGLLTTAGSSGTWATPGSRETARTLLAARTTPAGRPGELPPRPQLAVPASPTGPPMLINSAVPSSARVWNYWSGGKDWYEIDRAAADAYQRTAPQIIGMVSDASAFHVRALTHLAGLGITQFLDIGPGLPTPTSTHAVAQHLAPHARIVYADHDPHVTTHLRALCPGTAEGAITCIDADLRTPDAILGAARTVLDFGRPIALLLLGVLGHIPDDPQALAILRQLTGALPPGSYLVHHDAADTSPDLARAQHDHNNTGTTPYTLRTLDQLTLFYADLQPVAPGIGPVSQWRPDPGTVPQPTAIHGGVARVPVPA
ncbi:SAM-dependent methyltransferase [Streptomyces sp. NPDC004539]|uniref:SAM-dependent methyltransferase n=1 Tax=Streptomyces sp. NPDC004539 TaxID=3154280 RepID=UPI0033AA36F0